MTQTQVSIKEFDQCKKEMDCGQRVLRLLR